MKRFITAVASTTQVWLRLFPLKAHSSLRLAPLAPWKRETWHKKVLLALPMKSSFLSRGTTLQLPHTQMMLYPPQHSPVLQWAGAVSSSSPKSYSSGARACARWLISTEDTLPPFLLLSLLLFSSSSCLLQVHFIYHSFWTVPLAEFLLQPCPDRLYAIQAAILNHPGLGPACQNKEWRPARRALHG